MLTELRIRNVGVIDDVTLHLQPGLNVLTGETGAGKTMVVSALEMLLGARADADRVRAGAAMAAVEGSLLPPPAAAAEWLDDPDEELIVAREVAAADSSSARSRARISGRMAPVSALAACVGAAVELHGQSDTSKLALPAVQRELLDRFGGAELAAAARAYRRSYDEWIAVRDELAALRSSTRDRAREADRLRYELDEIDAVAPVLGEEDDLRATLARLEHVELLTTAAHTAGAALTDDAGARDGLAAAEAALRTAGGHDCELDELADRVAALLVETQEAGIDLRRYATALEADPRQLESARQRHADLVRLSRKYGEAASGEIDTAGVLAYAERARDTLVSLDAGDEHLTALEEQRVALEQRLVADAQVLHDEREAAGKRLAQVVELHLAELAMEGARLDVAVEASEPGPTGADKIVFLLAANPGESALPLGKAASGGERSRIALAVRLALTAADDTQVLVFDEVDAGIGGATAHAVGRKLAGLARGRQVLCVTHLAQLAAYADAHFLVSKVHDGGRAVARVEPLDGPDRVSELSRMLAGTPDSDSAVEHAAELLERAQEQVSSA